MKRYFFLMTALVGLVFSALAGDWVYDGTTDSLDNLLAGVTATDGAKTCTITAPNKFSFVGGWQALAAPLNDGDEKDNAPSNCPGVYRADSRKAYLTFGPRNGLAIICR